MLKNLREWVACAELKGIGPRKKYLLLSETGFDPAELLSKCDSQLIRHSLPKAAVDQLALYRRGLWPDPDYLQMLESWLQQSDHHLIPLSSQDYPALLKEIPDPPVMLYVWGDPTPLHLPQLAIVGSRSATRNGLNLSHDFAKALSEAGLVVTSGLARGVDGAAHNGAVGLLKPTVAVLGSGLQRLYPRQHSELAREIVACGGAIVSEYPLAMSPLAHNFPRRNRIISGMSVGVLVIEAAQRSGSLITARVALEQCREVFALPGAINNPQSHGCHALIRQGATLVESVDHIIEQLGALLGSYPRDVQEVTEEVIGVTEEDAWLLDQIGFNLITLDQLVEITGMGVSELIPKLVAMELKKYIEKTADGYLRLI